MSIVYQTNKTTGITYAYEATSVWIPELKQPRSKRKYLGRVDEYGNIIPSCGKRGRKQSSGPSKTENKQNQELEAAKKTIQLQTQRILELEAEIRKLQNIIRKSVNSLSEAL